MTPIAFTEMNIKRAPSASGIYALYRDGEVIYYGHAAGKATIQSRLKEDIAGRGAPGTRNAVSFTWEACIDPEDREAALLAEFQKVYSSLPLCNASPRSG
jgi:hypothetical protein